MLLQVKKIINPRRTGGKKPLITLLKKQDLDCCNIWCGLTLVSIPNELFCAAMWDRSYSLVGSRFENGKQIFAHCCSIYHIFILFNITKQNDK